MAERIVILALETADYDVERAEQFLNATSEEKKSSNENCDLIMLVITDTSLSCWEDGVALLLYIYLQKREAKTNPRRYR